MPRFRLWEELNPRECGGKSPRKSQRWPEIRTRVEPGKCEGDRAAGMRYFVFVLVTIASSMLFEWDAESSSWTLGTEGKSIGGVGEAREGV